ncbi:MAG TPA: hypothetical protein VNM22_11270 [Candidatus Limnocylindrales bacterium]|nr:hypothetical protein [Candidatus Limnocylindrales bacterium]
MISAREGDFIETVEHLIFDVKGFVHPKTHVIAFLRYFPDPDGTRLRNGVRYKKVYALNDRYQILKEKFPHYLYQDQRIQDTILQAVPHERIGKIYRPQEYLWEVMNEESAISQPHGEILRSFVRILQEASQIPLTALGISGSFLVGLATPRSDLDWIVYGSQQGLKVYEGMAKLFQNPDSPIRPYRPEELRKLWEFRSQDTALSFEEFVKFERRKRLQGKFEVGKVCKGIPSAQQTLDFYIRLLKDRDEITERYEDCVYTPMGTAWVEGIVQNDEEALFTPCRYPLVVRRVRWIERKPLPFSDTFSPSFFSFQKGLDSLQELISYRGRFCGARKGEVIQAQGTLEWVEDIRGDSYFRLVVGNNRSDFLKICDY